MRRVSATAQQGPTGRTLISGISNAYVARCRSLLIFSFPFLLIITLVCVGGNAASNYNKPVFKGASTPGGATPQSLSSTSTSSTSWRPQDGGLRRRTFHEESVNDGLATRSERTAASQEAPEQYTSDKINGRLRGEVVQNSEQTALPQEVTDPREKPQRGTNTQEIVVPHDTGNHPRFGPLSAIAMSDFKSNVRATSSSVDVKAETEQGSAAEDQPSDISDAEPVDPILTDLADATLNFSHKNMDMKHGAVVLTDATFDKIVESSPFLLVLFYAPWCHWSRAALPEFDAVAKLLAGGANTDALLAKVDCTENPKVSRDQHILEYPVIKVFMDGEARQYDGEDKLNGYLFYLSKLTV